MVYRIWIFGSQVHVVKPPGAVLVLIIAFFLDHPPELRPHEKRLVLVLGREHLNIIDIIPEFYIIGLRDIDQEATVHILERVLAFVHQNPAIII